MKKMYAPGLVLAFWALVLSCPLFVHAHGTGSRIVADNKAVTVEFFYSDGEPMAYAAVLVFSSEDEQTEYQNGRTDRTGRFAFYPDQGGTWRIEANDGMGHKARQSVTVSEAMPGQADPGETKSPVADAPAGAPSVVLKSLLGVSLILNHYFAFFLWKRKKNKQIRSA